MCLAGFFSLDNDDAPGNAGLWDQITALRWVRCVLNCFQYRHHADIFLQLTFLSSIFSRCCKHFDLVFHWSFVTPQSVDKIVFMCYPERGSKES